MKFIALIFLLLIFFGCSSIQTLPKNYFYKDGYIDIHSPNQEGWVEYEKSQSRILFAKKGEKYNETYVAGVWFFSLQPTNNNNDFLLLIKREATKISNPNRFSVIESDIKISDERDYPCVVIKSLLKDNDAKTLRENEELLMSEKALYCRDPKRKDAGFMIKYSFRGGTKISKFRLRGR